MAAAALAAAALVTAAAAGCTIVVPPGGGNGDGGDGGKKPMPFPVPTADVKPPKIIEAHLLFVMNLHQSSANLAPDYGQLATTLVAGLEQRGIDVVRWAVVPTYPGQDGLRLLLGQAALSSGGTTRITPPTNLIPDAGSFPIPLPGGGPPADLAPPTYPDPTGQGTDIISTLQQLAASGRFDGIGTTNEAEGTVRVGQHLVDAQLPPELGGLDGTAFFDRPRNLFIVVYLQPLARRCALADANCHVDGRSPADIFTETNADRTATWLHFASGGIPIDQVVHVAIATKEGESPDAFRARCGAVNGFPKALFDVMEPSGNLYFDPLMTALNQANPGTGQAADLCDLLGELSRDELHRPSMNRLVNSISAMAGSAPN
jgi:hypothetical protein